MICQSLLLRSANSIARGRGTGVKEKGGIYSVHHSHQLPTASRTTGARASLQHHISAVCVGKSSHSM